jgi:hypothetical protein
MQVVNLILNRKVKNIQPRFIEHNVGMGENGGLIFTVNTGPHIRFNILVQGLFNGVQVKKLIQIITYLLKFFCTSVLLSGMQSIIMMVSLPPRILIDASPRFPYMSKKPS